MTALEVTDLRVVTEEGVPLVRGLSFAVHARGVLCLVGESGSGKTTTARAICGLLPVGLRASGSVSLFGKELLTGDPRAWREIRGQVCLFLPQDPLAALNPARRIGIQLREAYAVRGNSHPSRREVAEVMATVSLPVEPVFLHRYPHELSGGQRQRLLLAVAAVLRPSVLIVDEPTSAVDAVLRRRMIQLLIDLQDRVGFALLAILHDLHVVRRLGHDIVVLKEGVVVESGKVAEVLRQPQAAYTKRLVTAATLPHSNAAA